MTKLTSSRTRTRRLVLDTRNFTLPRSRRLGPLFRRLHEYRPGEPFLFGDYANDGEYAEEFIEFYRTLDEYIGKIHESLTDSDDKTRAYSLILGRFYLNVEGRELEGVVPQDQYEVRREELIADLESLTGHNGRQMCKRIVKGETVFDGNHDDIAPDLVVIPVDRFDLNSGFSGEEAVFTEGPRNGIHKFENSLLYATDPDLDLTDANLFDVTLAILDMMDAEGDTAFDGESLRT